jgi:hypothetical protein
MPEDHAFVSPDEWLNARLALLAISVFPENTSQKANGVSDERLW